MGLSDEFESSRSHILHQDPLPTVSQALHKLVDDETRLQTDPISIQTMVLATPVAIPQTATPVFPYASSSTYGFKGKGNNVRRHNNKKFFLYVVSLRAKVIPLKPITLIRVFFRTLLL